MSTVREDTTKIVLTRSGADEFWQTIFEHYAGKSPRKWKYLAMLALRENADWPLEYIGLAFSHPKGHVKRCLDRVKKELRKQFGTTGSMRPQCPDAQQPSGKPAGEPTGQAAA